MTSFRGAKPISWDRVPPTNTTFASKRNAISSAASTARAAVSEPSVPAATVR